MEQSQPDGGAPSMARGAEVDSNQNGLPRETDRAAGPQSKQEQVEQLEDPDTADSPRISEAEDRQRSPARHPTASAKKHLCIFSSAGKPIFSSRGDEQMLAPMLGIVQAIIGLSSSASGGGPSDSGDTLQSVIAGRRKFVFIQRGDLNLLAVATTGESEPYLKLQLEYLYHQAVLLLTATRIHRCFKTNASYDLRGLLGGTQAVFNGLVDMFLPEREVAGCVLTGGVPTLPLDPGVRNDVGEVIIGACSSIQVLYAVVLCGTRLVTLVQPRDAHLHLHGSDLMLLINFIATSASFRRSESWTPVCLPRFNDSGFLYSYVAYLDEEIDLCLLLISANDDPGQFRACCECREEIEAGLSDRQCIRAIAESTDESRSRAVARYSNAAMAFHFVYKYCPSRPSSASLSVVTSASSVVLPQCLVSSFFFPYIDDEAKQRIWNKYVSASLRLRHGGRTGWKAACSMADGAAGDERVGQKQAGQRVDGEGGDSGGSTRRPTMMDVFEVEPEHTLTYELSESDCIVVNVGPDFELYALMSAAPDLSDIVQSCNRLIRSIKQEDQWLFMTHVMNWPVS